MESLELLMNGLAFAMHPDNLIFAFVGCFLGTLIGVIPGIGPSAGIAILIPVTFGMEPASAIIMLAAIYYGAMYGGTITSVLVNVPGEASSSVSCFEGYPMAKSGRAGPALAMSAIGSFVGGSIAALGLVFVALPLARAALKFGPTEMFALIVVALSLVTALAGKSIVRGGVSAALGLLIATVGIDPLMGGYRLTFGVRELYDGFSIVPAVMGLFGIGEILISTENPIGQVIDAKVRSLVPSRRDVMSSIMPMLRGTAIGIFFGVIPGVGATPASFMAYAAEKRVSKTPEKFGTGMIEGLVGPETSNNACANAALIPLFTLGIPGSTAAAVLLGGFMMNGVVPGPFMFAEHGELVWTVIASLYVGNVMLLILNLPLIPIWVALLRIPYSILFALILTFVVVGGYSLRNSVFDIWVILGFGVVGYLFRKLDIPLAPLVMTLVLTPFMEQGLRRSLTLSGGDYTVFFTRPISAVLLVIAALSILSTTVGTFSAVKGKEAEV